MAEFISKLKPNVYITVEETADWLGIKPEKIDVPQAEVKSSLVIQDLTYTAKAVGVLGDAVSIEYIDGASSVAVLANAITVTFPNGATDADTIKALIEAFPAAAALVTIAVSGTGATNQASPVAATNLAGGIDDVPFPEDDVSTRRTRLELLMQVACDYVERHIQTNVLTKTKQEDLDGNNSNIIVPSHWPIRKINSIFIDFNRNFGPETKLDEINFLLRSSADITQDADISLLPEVGTDIALRDDDENNVIGRVFSGSELGAVRVNYEAGWALDLADVPGPLKLATMQLVEFYDFSRSNRTLGVSSKGQMGQNFTKFRDGIPEQIVEQIDPYENMSLGIYQKPQINLFGV